MYNEKLEALISIALADGKLTKKEKEVLFKNAASMGIDHDEFEMYLESRLAKRKEDIDQEWLQQSKAEYAEKKEKVLRELDKFIQTAIADGSITPTKRQNIIDTIYEKYDYLFKFDGGAEVSLYLDAKVVAFQEARQAEEEARQAEEEARQAEEKLAEEEKSSFKTLADKIEKISSNLNIEGKNPIEINQAKDAMSEEIINTIAMFPVPNSKNGILELLALACSKAKYRGGLWGTITGRMKMYVAITLTIALIGVIAGLIIDREDVWVLVVLAPICFLMFGGFAFFVTNKDIIRYNKVAEAWHDKFEQVILKGRSLRDDEAFTQQLNYYESQLKN